PPPCRAAKARIPQQPQAPVGSLQAAASRENIFPSSVERATQTRRFSSPSLSPLPCHATYTAPDLSAAIEPPPSSPPENRITFSCGSKPVRESFIRAYSIGAPGPPRSCGPFQAT